MNVPLDVRHTPNNESGDFSNSSQTLSQYILPFPLDQCCVAHPPTKACSWVNCTSPAMPVTNSGTIFLLVPCLDYSQQQFPADQFDFQDIGLDLEYFPCNLSEPQTLDNYISTETAASQALSLNGLPTMANGGISPSTLDSHAIIGPETQSSASSLAANYSACSSVPEASQDIQPSSNQKNQKPACPELDCGATFKRTHDLKRHVTTVHGPKQNCPYSYCRYKTGRKDKMLEHARKRHGKA